MSEVKTWQLVNPEGLILIETQKANPHPTDLTGKTLVLQWNGKHNGDVFLGRIAELLEENVPEVKVVRRWETAEGATANEQNPEASREAARKVAALNPDMVIAATGD